MPPRSPDPGHLVSDLANLLPFRLRRCVVVVPVADIGPSGAPQPVVFAELRGDTSDDADAIARLLIGRFPTLDGAELILFLIDDEPRPAIIHSLALAARAAGAAVVTAICATGTDAGSVWACCCGCGSAGLVPEPDPVRDIVDPSPAGPLGELADALLAAQPSKVIERRARMLATAPSPYAGQVVDRLHRLLDRSAPADRALCDADLVEALSHAGYFHEALTVLLERTGPMNALLQQVVCGMPSPHVAPAALLLSLGALLLDEGPLACAAARRAVDAAPSWRRAQLVQQIAEKGPPPQHVRAHLHGLRAF